MASTQDSRTQNMWLQEIREGQGDYEQEVMCVDEVDLYKCFSSCTKNPGHVQFVGVNKFRSEHLPKRYQSDQKLSDLVRAQADVTCLIKVSCVSPDRPESFPFYKYRGRSDFSRSGTGWASHVIIHTAEHKVKSWYKPCQCHTCQLSGEPRSDWALVRIFTANHVVFDKSEAEACKCYFFYDNAQQQLSECPVIAGQVHKVDCYSGDDISGVWYYSHDLVLARRLGEMSDRYDRMCWNLRQEYRVLSHVVTARDTEEKNENSCQGNCDEKEAVGESHDDSHDLYHPEHGPVIITSHPHGCSKMVTLGHVTDRQVRLFGHRIGNIWYEYSTATCPGSSGAPVFVLDRRNGSTCHPHRGHVSGHGSQQINRSGVNMDYV